MAASSSPWHFHDSQCDYYGCPNPQTRVSPVNYEVPSVSGPKMSRPLVGNSQPMLCDPDRARLEHEMMITTRRLEDLKADLQGRDAEASHEQELNWNQARTAQLPFDPTNPQYAAQYSQHGFAYPQRAPDQQHMQIPGFTHSNSYLPQAPALSDNNTKYPSIDPHSAIPKRSAYPLITQEAFAAVPKFQKPASVDHRSLSSATSNTKFTPSTGSSRAQSPSPRPKRAMSAASQARLEDLFLSPAPGESRNVGIHDVPGASQASFHSLKSGQVTKPQSIARSGWADGGDFWGFSGSARSDADHKSHSQPSKINSAKIDSLAGWNQVKMQDDSNCTGDGQGGRDWSDVASGDWGLPSQSGIKEISRPNNDIPERWMSSSSLFKSPMRKNDAKWGTETEIDFSARSKPVQQECGCSQCVRAARGDVSEDGSEAGWKSGHAGSEISTDSWGMAKSEKKMNDSLGNIGVEKKATSSAEFFPKYDAAFMVPKLACDWSNVGWGGAATDAGCKPDSQGCGPQKGSHSVRESGSRIDSENAEPTYNWSDWDLKSAKDYSSRDASTKTIDSLQSRVAELESALYDFQEQTYNTKPTTSSEVDFLRSLVTSDIAHREAIHRVEVKLADMSLPRQNEQRSKRFADAW